MHVLYCSLLAAAAAASSLSAHAEGARPDVLSRFSQLPQIYENNPSCPLPANIHGVVTYVFADGKDGFVIADEQRSTRGGVIVRPAAGGEMPDGAYALEPGETVNVAGTTAYRNSTVEIVAANVLRTGRAELEAPPPMKLSDFRRGLLHLRRISTSGTVRNCASQPRADGKSDCVLWLDVLGAREPVGVVVQGAEPSSVFRKGVLVEVDGVAFTDFGEDGAPIASHIEAFQWNIRLAGGGVASSWRMAAIVACALLGVVLAALAAILLHVLRRRRREALLAADRRRIAGELHDTIEQHLATAKLYLSAALNMGDDKSKIVRAVKMAESVLVHAKVEVRDAVMDLRGDGSSGLSLREELGLIARSVSDGGAVYVRTSLSRLPEMQDRSRRRDLVAIVREAVTNAIKHAHAGCIVLVADVPAGDGAGGFVLRVLNDGDPFDAKTALGPETGHYGLSGMRERAARSRLLLEFVNTEKWCGIRLEVGK